MAQLAISVVQQDVDLTAGVGPGNFSFPCMALLSAEVNHQDHHRGNDSGQHDERRQHDQRCAVQMEKDSSCVGKQQGEEENHESEQIGEQKSSRRWPSTHWGNPRAERKPESAIGRQHRQEHKQSGDTQTPAPAIYGHLPLDFQRRSDNAKKESLATDARDLVSNLANEGLDLSSSPQRVLTRSEERRVGKECRSRWSPY